MNNKSETLDVIDHWTIYLIVLIVFGSLNS